MWKLPARRGTRGWAIDIDTDKLRNTDGIIVRSSAGLELALAATPDSPVFEQFFPLYDQAFVLPSEKEEAAGFAACLALNAGAEFESLSGQYGPFIELVATVSDPITGTIVGGLNFIGMAHGPGKDVPVTANLNYIFTTAAGRGRGHFHPMLAAVAEVLAAIFATAPSPPLIFVEQNDPFRMSPEAYAEDTAHAGIDQFDRLLVWARAGARVLDFPYVQPGLSASQPADDTLVYTVLDPPSDRLDARILAGHLERFFAISVAKGAPVRGVEAVDEQLSLLRNGRYEGGVELLDPRPLLGEITARADRWSHWRSRPASFAAALRG